MDKKNSWTAIIKPEDIVNNLAAFVGQWNTGVDVKVNIPHQTLEGPIIVKNYEDYPKKEKRSGA